MAISRQRGRQPIALAVAFVAGAMAGGVLVWNVGTPTVSRVALADDCGEPDVEVLASPKRAPGPGPEPEAHDARGLALAPLDHCLLPRNVRCRRFGHDQSPE